VITANYLSLRLHGRLRTRIGKQAKIELSAHFMFYEEIDAILATRATSQPAVVMENSGCTTASAKMVGVLSLCICRCYYILIADVEDGSRCGNSVASSPSRESVSTDLSTSLHSEVAGCDQQDQQEPKS